MSSVRRAFILIAAGQFVFVGAGYATHVILARALGPALYGTYGVLLSVLSTVALVLTSGMPEAISKFAAQRPLEADGIVRSGLRVQLVFSLILAALFALASPLLARLLNDPSLASKLAASALAVPPVALYAAMTGFFNGRRRFAAQALAVGSYGVLRCVFVVGFSELLRIWGAVVGFALAPAVVVLGSLPALARGAPSVRVDGRALWAFARPVILFNVALNALMGLDLFVVKALTSNPDSVGFYAAAATIAKIPYFVFSALGSVLLPIVSAASDDARGVLGAARSALRLTFLASLAVAAVVLPLSKPILTTLYGPSYGVAALPLALLFVSGTLFTMFFSVAYTLSGLGKPAIAMRVAFVGLGAEVPLAIALTKGFGNAGAAASSALIGFGLVLLLLALARSELGSVLSLTTCLRAGIAFAVTLALGHVLPHVGKASLLCALPLAIANVGVLLLSREISLGELLAFVRREPNASNAAG